MRIFILVLCGSLFFMNGKSQSPKDICPLLIGSEVPNISIQDIKGNDRFLSDCLSGIPTVLIFYRGGWCPYCNSHFGEIAKVEEEIRLKGVQIIGISPDKPQELISSISKNGLPYTLLSDSKMQAADAFGISFTLDEKTRKKYKLYGIDLEEASGESHQKLPVPTVFLIDSQGKVTFSYSNPDYKTRISGSLLLEALNSIIK